MWNESNAANCIIQEKTAFVEVEGFVFHLW